MKKNLLIVSLFFLQWSAFAQCDLRFTQNESDIFVLTQDIIYGSNINSSGDTIDLLFDLYEPELSSETPRPMVILIHGGGFFDGTKRASEVRWFCEDLARRGIVAASISYRLEPDILSLTAPEKMIKAVMRGAEDAKASIRYFHKSVAEGNPYNINDEHIFIGGTSAGAIAALHAVYMDDYNEVPQHFQQWMLELGFDENLEGNSGNPGYSSKVAGVINISGALKTPEFLNNNADIPLFSAHNEVDLTVPYGWGHPYQIPFLPETSGSYLLNLKMKSLGGYSDLYTIYEFNHVPHTSAEDGSKIEYVYNNIMDKMATLFRHVIPCTELPTAVLEDVSPELNVYPNPVKDVIKLEGISHLEAYQLELINAIGMSTKLKANSNRIAIPSYLSKGTYILRGINSTDETTFTKTIILK